MKKLLQLIMLFTIFLGSISSVFAETSYLYYYGQGCPHCANVDAYMKGVDGYDRVNIEKKEVYFNQENAKAMSDDSLALGIEEGKGGVPFLIIDTDGERTYMIGDGPIIEHFTPILGEPVPNNAKYVVLAILALLAVVIPLGLIFGGKKSK